MLTNYNLSNKNKYCKLVSLANTYVSTFNNFYNIICRNYVRAVFRFKKKSLDNYDQIKFIKLMALSHNQNLNIIMYAINLNTGKLFFTLEQQHYLIYCLEELRALLIRTGKWSKSYVKYLKANIETPDVFPVESREQHIKDYKLWVSMKKRIHEIQLIFHNFNNNKNFGYYFFLDYGSKKTYKNLELDLLYYSALLFCPIFDINNLLNRVITINNTRLFYQDLVDFLMHKYLNSRVFGKNFYLTIFHESCRNKKLPTLNKPFFFKPVAWWTRLFKESLKQENPKYYQDWVYSFLDDCYWFTTEPPRLDFDTAKLYFYFMAVLDTLTRFSNEHNGILNGLKKLDGGPLLPNTSSESTKFTLSFIVPHILWNFDHHRMLWNWYPDGSHKALRFYPLIEGTTYYQISRYFGWCKKLFKYNAFYKYWDEETQSGHIYNNL